MQTSTPTNNMPQTGLGLDLRNPQFTDPLFAKVMESGVGGFVKLVNKGGAILMKGVNFTPPEKIKKKLISVKEKREMQRRQAFVDRSNFNSVRKMIDF
mgnify:FL=1